MLSLACCCCLNLQIKTRYAGHWVNSVAHIAWSHGPREMRRGWGVEVCSDRGGGAHFQVRGTLKKTASLWMIIVYKAISTDDYKDQWPCTASSPDLDLARRLLPQPSGIFRFYLITYAHWNQRMESPVQRDDPGYYPNNWSQTNTYLSLPPDD